MLKKQDFKKYLVLTIIFGILMLYFGVTTINLLFVNGPDSNVFWLKEETIYYEDSERLELTFKNLSLKTYDNLQLRINIKDNITGESSLLEEFTINIIPFGGITTQVNLSNNYYENKDIEIIYSDKNDNLFVLMQEDDYAPMKTMIIVDIVLFVVGIAGFATFLPLFIVKRNKKELN